MQAVFWNEREKRLRAFWRVLLVSGVFTAVSWLIDQLGENMSPALAGETVRLAANLLRLVLVVGLLVLAARFVDKRPFSAYGLNLTHGYWWLDFGIGVLIAAALITFVFFAASWFGWATLEQSLGQREISVLVVSLSRPLLGILADVIALELFFRGFLITNLGEGFNFANGLLDPLVKRVGNFDMGFGNYRFNQALIQNLNYKLGGGLGWVVSSLLFTLVRIGNVTPNMTLLSDLLKGAILLGLAFILTRQLGMAVGLNFGWNFVRSNIFGLQVRGLIVTEISLFVVYLSGPPFFTGGEQGFEGSLLGVIALGIGSALIIWWVQFRSERIERDFDPWVFEYENSK